MEKPDQLISSKLPLDIWVTMFALCYFTGCVFFYGLFKAKLIVLFSGNFKGKIDDITEVSKTAELIGLHDLVHVCKNYVKEEEFLNAEACSKSHRDKMFNTRELLIRQGHLAGEASI